MLYDITYMQNLKNKPERKQAQRYREQIGGCQGVMCVGGRGGLLLKNKYSASTTTYLLTKCICTLKKAIKGK